MVKQLITVILLLTPVLLSAQDDIYHFNRENTHYVRDGKNKSRKQAYTPSNQPEKRKTVQRGSTYTPKDLLIPQNEYKEIPIKEDSALLKVQDASSLDSWQESQDSVQSVSLKSPYTMYVEQGNPLPVTKFLGIPVDGTLSEMKWKLIKKGFRENTDIKKPENMEILYGQFNGHDVDVFVCTNNNKVDRIMLCDKVYMDEGDIRIRFNNLCYQFERNPKYFSSKSSQAISDDEDISYEMSVHSKKYEASFCQIGDSIENAEVIRKVLLCTYSVEETENPSSEIIFETYRTSSILRLEAMLNKTVWFRICEFHGKYYIAMYYDNEYNRADGRDL